MSRVPASALVRCSVCATAAVCTRGAIATAFGGFSPVTVVDLLVLRGAMASSVAIACDVLATANRLRTAEGRGPAFTVRLAGSGARGARSMAGSLIGPSVPASRAAVIVVPGLGITGEDEVAARLTARDAVAAGRVLASAAAQGSAIATSCSGAFLLAAAGLLDGRRATTAWWLAPLLQRLYPAVRVAGEATVVTDGPVTTAGAALAQMDLMLSVVARHAGTALAERCARYLLLDGRRSQSRYMAVGYLAAADARVARAEGWARGRLDRPVSVGEFAAAAGLSPRTFARHVARATGLSPVRLLQRLRVEAAVELLETTRLPFDEIGRRVGYAEPSTLRQAMRRDGRGGARAIRAP